MKRLPVLALTACALISAGFVALGVWQIERRVWKLALIERVDQRVHAAPAPPPLREQWAGVSAVHDEYLHVRLSGTFVPLQDTLVQASTELGPGYWLLAPLRLNNGDVVLINRGFVTPDWRSQGARQWHEPQGPVSLTGLLRISEPGGGFLRDNAPAADRWYSRDVKAIAARHGLGGVAPYFVDADEPSMASADPEQTPVGGLTVISFPNNHLQYAITWFVLALMTVWAAWRLWRLERHGPAEN